MAKIDKLTEQARAHLDQDEVIEAAVLGSYEYRMPASKQTAVRAGVLLATGRRIVFYAKKLTGYDLESFPYQNISSFETSKGMMGHSFRFAASGNDVHLKWINVGDVPGFAALVRERVGRRPAGPAGPPASAPAPVDPMAAMQQLKAMLDAGLISQPEFDAKRAEVLARM